MPLTDYSIVYTYFLHALGDEKIHWTRFTTIFAVLWWSGTEPTVPRRHVCTVVGCLGLQALHHFIFECCFDVSLLKTWEDSQIIQAMDHKPQTPRADR